jgi:hypothetical protein
MNLLIRYRSGEDEMTDRVISDVVIESPNMLHAFCQLRGEGRSFALNRIEHAVDLQTGEVIPDIWQFFGLPSRKSTPLIMPVFSEYPRAMSTEEAQRQRKTDKQALFRCFKHPVIAETFKAKLYDLFGSRCFYCGATETLELDHHIPQYLGGRLVAGNVVLLCSRCNSAKGDKHPRMFYSTQQLVPLESIFKAQLELFDFRFDWTRWSRHSKEYLLSLGVSMEDVEYALKNFDQPLHE